MKYKKSYSHICNKKLDKYKDNKSIYSAPSIHHILGTESFNVSLKRVQIRMTELDLCAITVKIYKPHSSKILNH